MKYNRDHFKQSVAMAGCNKTKTDQVNIIK